MDIFVHVFIIFVLRVHSSLKAKIKQKYKDPMVLKKKKISQDRHKSWMDY